MDTPLDANVSATDAAQQAAALGHESNTPGTPVMSVIMPVYNGERFLDEAIESVRTQTLANIELIVVDDGSHDASALIAEHHAEQDARVRVIRLEHVGLANALNEGIGAARSDWIARLDADDIALPQRLERQYAFIRDNPDIAAVGAYGFDIGERGRTVVALNRKGPATRAEYQRQWQAGFIPFLTPTMVFRRDVALEVGGYRQEYFPSEDTDFNNRIADNHVVLVIPEPLIYYRIHDRSESYTQVVRQMRIMERVKANSLRRRAGHPEYSSEEFKARSRHTPRLQRMRQELEWHSQGYYRRAGASLASGKLSGLLWLLASALVYPPLPLSRFRSQRVLGFVVSRSWKKLRSGLKQD